MALAVFASNLPRLRKDRHNSRGRRTDPPLVVTVADMVVVAVFC